ncbi:MULTISPECIES: ABC transporter permease/substrate-binding protein [Rhodopseudomonas]|uniref:ABC transporter permease n=1 Tax=Rhodopseudomonas palustris TaxID=1076 RepID=A0A0D7F344_RHOPL|nr:MULTISPECIES: ABC transporter permease/substrate-binding protein [Rhodopseudomonas]KIZ47518.1 ABC transporter permease [Rhodopseudomonas palustris]MDF3811712.1 ABC transporter permease/substrate-binding protein [Rhodopseudomonas sp. BAL398]WOK17901.1 ABC transporter permease/substrate-binding protein [Rhodopseudomonas sp. BAL398]
MDDTLTNALRVLPDYLGHHVLLSAASLGLGFAISFPLALGASRNARLRWFALTFVSLVQTVPGLALMALFYPLLLALAALSETLFGRGFSAFGFLPALIALTLYSMLPITRNIVTGIAQLDPALVEAARGVGMTSSQRLIRVELPLIAPVMMAGIRTAAVWVIGTATLATPVGQTSLGNYIFSGLQTENWVRVLFGCGVSAALALTVDQLLGLIESGVATRRRWRIVAGATGLLLGIGLAGAATMSTAKPDYTIGAKSFSEQYILASLIGQRLEARGSTVMQHSGLGSAVIFRALSENDIDVYVDYTGTIWTNVMGRKDQPPREVMLQEITKWLKREYGVTVVGSLGFENAYAMAMRRDRAKSMGITSIADLARYAPQLSLGIDFEFLARPEWRALRDGYGLKFASSREFQSTFMYRAVVTGEVDVISAFSSDGRIEADKLLVLDDPKAKIPPYDAIVMIAPGRANDDELTAALKPLIGNISVEMMRKANFMVDRPNAALTPHAAAHWLDRQVRQHETGAAAAAK